MPKPPPMTMQELLALPVTVGLPDVCRALDISESQAYQLMAAGIFPLPDKRSGAAGRHQYARADLFRHLGLDPAMVTAHAATQPDAA